jgi:Ca2+-binding EF-hand superfamily protein
VNGDGALDKAELREQLKLWGVSQRSVEEFFAHVDASHDGVLSFEEILNDKAGRCMLEYISDCLRDNERVRLRND